MLYHSVFFQPLPREYYFEYHLKDFTNRKRSLRLYPLDATFTFANRRGINSAPIDTLRLKISRQFQLLTFSQSQTRKFQL